MRRSEFCERFFYGIIEAMIFCLIVIVAAWFAQSTSPVIHSAAPTLYDVMQVTSEFVEVRWNQVSLIQDCPGRIEPAFVGEQATEQLPSYPFIVESKPRTFIRRYEFPRYMPPGEYELRITLVAHCNPLFPTEQVIWIAVRKP